MLFDSKWNNDTPLDSLFPWIMRFTSVHVVCVWRVWRCLFNLNLKQPILLAFLPFNSFIHSFSAAEMQNLLGGCWFNLNMDEKIHKFNQKFDLTHITRAVHFKSGTNSLPLMHSGNTAKQQQAKLMTCTVKPFRESLRVYTTVKSIRRDFFSLSLSSHHLNFLALFCHGLLF